MLELVRRQIVVLLASALTLGCASAPRHGKMSSLSIASENEWEACAHHVPTEVCVRCHPDLVGEFRAKGDWCPEHDVPESQCLECHPDLDFSPAEQPPSHADVKEIVREGEDLEDLEANLVAGKITVFDFRADWCPPCRKVDEHLFMLLRDDSNVAIRKLNIVTWESPLASRYLRDVPELPYLMIYDASGVKVGEMHGADLPKVDLLLEKARRSS